MSSGEYLCNDLHAGRADGGAGFPANQRTGRSRFFNMVSCSTLYFEPATAKTLFKNAHIAALRVMD
jgi:hypothetical protein